MKSQLMHIKNFAIVSSLFLLAACNNPKTTKDKTTDVAKTDITACYHYIKDKDTIVLKTINVGTSITGILQYNFFGKDKNEGTILGNMRGDVLVADYTFMSEGIQSVRQVAFKKMDHAFVEGYGDIETKDDKAYFKNIDSLQYQNEQVLTAFDCGD